MQSFVDLAAVCDGLRLNDWSLFSKESEAVEHENEVFAAWSVHIGNKGALQCAKRTGNEVMKRKCFEKHLESLRKLRRAVGALKKWLDEKMLDFHNPECFDTESGEAPLAQLDQPS